MFLSDQDSPHFELKFLCPSSFKNLYQFGSSYIQLQFKVFGIYNTPVEGEIASHLHDTERGEQGCLPAIGLVHVKSEYSLC
jgi:hypothetical protein